ncbi:MAG: hypothetical protein R2747_02665 [Pyrinomonadaceae bacterium]
MKTITAAIFILILCLSVSAQKKMTDREFEGFKGDVKTVSIETRPMSGSGVTERNKKRTVWEKWTYNFAGMKMEESNPQGKSKTNFTYIDDYKSAEMTVEGKAETVSNKYVYEYDSQGRVKTEKNYFNKNRPPIVKTVKYDSNGRIIEKTVNGPTALTKYSYKYDAKGNLIEELQEQKGKGEFGTDSKSRTVYSDYKLDAQGNWTERKSTLYYEGDGRTTEYVSMDYQVFTYFD